MRWTHPCYLHQRNPARLWSRECWIKKKNKNVSLIISKIMLMGKSCFSIAVGCYQRYMNHQHRYCFSCSVCELDWCIFSFWRLGTLGCQLPPSYPVFFTDVVQLKAPWMSPYSAEHLEILEEFGPCTAPAPLQSIPHTCRWVRVWWWRWMHLQYVVDMVPWCL